MESEHHVNSKGGGGGGGGGSEEDGTRDAALTGVIARSGLLGVSDWLR